MKVWTFYHTTVKLNTVSSPKCNQRQVVLILMQMKIQINNKRIKANRKKKESSKICKELLDQGGRSMSNMLSGLKWDSLQTPERESQARHVLQGHPWSCRLIPLLKDLLFMLCKNTRNFHPKKYRPLTYNTNYVLYENIFPIHCQSMEFYLCRHIGPAK